MEFAGRRAIVAMLIGGAMALGSCGSRTALSSHTSGTTDAAPSGSGRAWLPESDNPTIPVGYDAYRQWDRWPALRLGVRASMRSTYDRTGGNEAADASHFIRVDDDAATALDVAGPGVLYFFRANRWHGSPWHFDLDGRDLVLAETGTDDPGSAPPDSVFMPSTPYSPPLAWTWSATKGADLVAAPMQFASSLRIRYGHTFYGTGYFIYDSFPLGAGNTSRPLDEPVAAWERAPDDVIHLLEQAGQDIAPRDGLDTKQGSVSVPAEPAQVVLVDLVGPASVRALKLTVPKAEAAALGARTLEITWDDMGWRGVSAPVSLFFGSGSLYNRDDREYLVKALPVNIHFEGDTVTFAVYFPMPFFAKAHITLGGAGTAVSRVDWETRTEPYRGPRNWVGYFHADYMDVPRPTPGQDLVLLDTTQGALGRDWCGSFVGATVSFSDRGVLCGLEGDPRFFFDDSQSPQVQGTGTEEWGGGGDYWQGGQTTTLPLFGHPVGAPGGQGCAPGRLRNSDDGIESMYRFLLADAMPFGKNARIQLEHGGLDQIDEHYRSVAYWYGLPGACLKKTDTFRVGDLDGERAHQYSSPDASPSEVVESRFDLGVDHVYTADGQPTSTVAYGTAFATGRHTRGTSEFTLTVDPANFGVLLRRMLDYSYPDQRAEVFVADGAVAEEARAFAHAGTWYTAGSNVAVFSSPASEQQALASRVLTPSNRRWREDEFLIARALTEGKSQLRVRIVFSPLHLAVAPGMPLAEEAWSEFIYGAYVWQLPPPP